MTGRNDSPPESVAAFTVRPADQTDRDGLAALKVLWAGLDEPIPADEVNGLGDDLVEWMRERGDSVVCRVAELDGRLVGMAWLVVFSRVPNLRASVRLTGDVQSVFVVAEHRGLGIGAALVASLCEEADARGVARVTVSSTPRATGLYRRAGFRAASTLLERAAGDS